MAADNIDGASNQNKFMKGVYTSMKFTKASIIILLVTFLVFAAGIANLVYSINIGEGVPIGIGIAALMTGIFIACIVTAVKEAKRNADKIANGDGDGDDDDDDE
jgi:uncharacterized integral membrane protein